MPGRVQVTLPPVDQRFNLPRLACPRSARCASQASAEPTARTGGNLPFAQATEARVRAVQATGRPGAAGAAGSATASPPPTGPGPARRRTRSQTRTVTQPPQLVRQPPVQDSLRPQHIPRPGRRPPQSVALQPGRQSAERRRPPPSQAGPQGTPGHPLEQHAGPEPMLRAVVAHQRHELTAHVGHDSRDAHALLAQPVVPGHLNRRRPIRMDLHRRPPRNA
jgi:hypothetical protein